MTEAPHTRTRRLYPGLLPPSQYDIRASEHEVSKDLQQLYQCSSSQVSMISNTQSAVDSRGNARNKVKTI